MNSERPHHTTSMQRRTAQRSASSLLRRTVKFLAVAACAATMTSSVSGGGGTGDNMNGVVRTAEAHMSYSVARKLQIREEVTNLFYHGYNSYMRNAFPKDELKPLTCKGDDTFGGYALTLIDTLDMLALVGDYPEFMKQVHYVSTHVHYQARVVSVFETTIRVLGGLITAHHLAIKICKEKAASAEWQTYNHHQRHLFTYKDGLLKKAVELADLLLPAFDTPTGIPFNEINMRFGTQKSKGHTTCPAGAGSLLLEFGALSVLTGNCKYVTVAERALEGVWKHRSGQSLVGTLIDVFSGKWVNGESSIGASIDSFFEYMVKSYMYFGEDKFLHMWDEAYKAVQKYTYFGGWYLSSTIDLLNPIDNTDHKFNSLQAFWPGLQVLAGDVHNALDSWGKMWCIVEKIGLPPEYVDLSSFFAGTPQHRRNGPGYPLRPEFLESTYFLYRATNEERFLEISEDFVKKLTKTKQRCGFAAVVDVYSFTFEDKMDSFLLAETFKYLYMMFTPTDDDVRRENAIRNDKKKARVRHTLLLQQEVQIATQEAKRKLEASKREYLASVARAVDGTEAADVGEAAALGDGPVRRLLPHQIDVSEAVLDRYPSLPEEQPMAKFKLLYNLDDDEYVVNTEAHPLPINKASQSIFQQCREERSSFLLPLNEPAKCTADDYRAYQKVDRHLAPNRWDKRMLCKPVDYMRDIAPFIDGTFYDKGFCAAPPSTRVLGHSESVYAPRMSYDAVAKARASGKPIDGLGSRVFDVQVPVHVPADPLVAGSKPLKLHFSTQVQLPTGVSSLTAPAVVSHYGIHSVPLITDPEMLFLGTNDIYLRRSDGKDPEEYRAADAYVQCTNANFGPTLCEHLPKKTAAEDKKLKVAMTVNVYRPRVNLHGCRPSDMGDTSGFKKPFALAIDRGQCTFREKALSAQINGAAFAIMINHDDQLIHMGDSAATGPDFEGVALKIPLAMMSRTDEVNLLPPRTKDALANPNEAFAEVNIICARNAAEQYKMMGLSMLARPTDVLLYRHRMAPMMDAFITETSPSALRSHYTDPKVDCPKCVLSINIDSREKPVDPSNYASSPGIFAASFLGKDNRRLQFALAPRMPSPARLPLIADPATVVSTGVAYFFADAPQLSLAVVRRFTIVDPPAFNFYNNRLGMWLEKFGVQLGVGSSFLTVQSVVDAEPEAGGGSELAVEVTLFKDAESHNRFTIVDVVNEAFHQGHTLMLMRDKFVKDVTMELFDDGQEHLVQPKARG